MSTRRAIITGIGLTPMLSLPAIGAPDETPEDRLIRLTKEVIEAAQVVYPAIDGWTAIAGGSAGHGIIIHGMSYALLKSKQRPPELFRFTAEPEAGV